MAGSEPIPLVEDLLGAWPEVRFNIDLKDEPGIALLAEVVRRTGAWDRVCLTSFSGSRLRAARGLFDRPVCMATSPAVIAAIRYTLGQYQPGTGPGRAASRACSPAGWRTGRCGVPRYRRGWPRARSSGARTPSASTCMYGPSMTGRR